MILSSLFGDYVIKHNSLKSNLLCEDNINNI